MKKYVLLLMLWTLLEGKTHKANSLGTRKLCLATDVIGIF